MNKRLAKRHKRQVSRERGRQRVSEPDLRTPEQIKAAREASRAPDPSVPYRDSPANTPVNHNQDEAR
jgi:hypothetical protein